MTAVLGPSCAASHCGEDCPDCVSRPVRVSTAALDFMSPVASPAVGRSADAAAPTSNVPTSTTPAPAEKACTLPLSPITLPAAAAPAFGQPAAQSASASAAPDAGNAAERAATQPTRAAAAQEAAAAPTYTFSDPSAATDPKVQKANEAASRVVVGSSGSGMQPPVYNFTSPSVGVQGGAAAGSGVDAAAHSKVADEVGVRVAGTDSSCLRLFGAVLVYPCLAKQRIMSIQV